ncbi:hypothetical protein E4T44_01527 [Aureobasidium sp. EXF-8845]|nr:hypothetical protein E4T44_01527 [Aureobasidium sp. EXF-8845]KAI4857036.1 hypothetical protein E4T45_01484 [Aureobasidium sp. EXF-8846]
MNTLPTIRVRDRIGAGIATVIVIGNLLGGACLTIGGLEGDGIYLSTTYTQISNGAIIFYN